MSGMPGDPSEPDEPLVTEALARAAVGLVHPLFQNAVDAEVPGTFQAGHVVIMKPAVAPDTMPFADAILYEESFGDRSGWEVDYSVYARAKAELSWRTMRDSASVRAVSTHLLDIGDTAPGGGVYVDGIAVGVSGIHAWFDEALAASVAGFLKALARREVSRVTHSFVGR